MRASAPRHAVSAVERHVGRAAGSRWVDLLARLGLACRGVLHLIIGGAAARVALGRAYRPEGWKEAVLDVAGLGTISLVVLIVGLLGYGVWRLVQAIGDTERKGRKPWGLGTRLSFVLDGVGHAALAIVALKLLIGTPIDVRDDMVDNVAAFLPTAGGRTIVFAGGIALIYSAWTHFLETVRAIYAEDFPPGSLSPLARRIAVDVGRVGIFARGAVFGTMGFFLVRAALTLNPYEAKGVSGALAFFARQPPGRALIGAMAIGLFLYAIFCFVYARYRRIAKA